MLMTRCILDPRSSDDGTRISVMSRHTLSDGTTPDERITPQSYYRWLKVLAPPDTLVGAYYRKEISWPDYAREYNKYLGGKEQEQAVKSLCREAMASNVTIMCIEPTPERCHRRLLAEKCQRTEPRLTIRVR